MSGISDLFTGAKTDTSLEGLFSTKNAGPVKRTIGERTVINLNVNKSKKHKKKEEEDKAENQSESLSAEGPEDDESASEEDDEEKQEPQKKKKRSEDEDDEDLESKYYERILSKEDEQEKTVKEDEAEEDASDSDDSDDEEEKGSTSASAAKTIDFKENETERAERTTFVGNLHANVITSKKEYKAFKKFFLQFGEIDSIRFRSIAFNEPLPRKVAFVQQKLHASRDSINAYIVFKTKDDSRKSLSANAQIFSGLHLRVDSVSHPAKIDNNRAIFVGNLDFEEKEEELWNIFKDCGEIEFVRIIRDAKTNVGKGFGYVQFQDFTSVSRALLMNEKKLGEKKRKLRISRSKKMKKPDQEGNGKQRHKHMANLNDDQKTKLGRAKRVLGKADRATAGKQIIEGTRAKKGEAAAGIKGGKNRVKKPRIRQRSTEFRNARNARNSKSQ